MLQAPTHLHLNLHRQPFDFVGLVKKVDPRTNLTIYRNADEEVCSVFNSIAVDNMGNVIYGKIKCYADDAKKHLDKTIRYFWNSCGDLVSILEDFVSESRKVSTVFNTANGKPYKQVFVDYSNPSKWHKKSVLLEEI